MIAYVPARMNSERFPRKVLMNIGGKPLVSIVASNIAQCDNIESVYVLTDSTEVSDAIGGLNNPKIMCDTDTTGSCGTDRVFRYREKHGHSKPFVVLQSDCPSLSSDNIHRFIAKIESDQSAAVHTIICPMSAIDAALPQNVKTVLDNDGQVMYFSRSPIPHGSKKYYKHVGIYAFTQIVIDKYMDTLRTFTTHAVDSESLEQLSWMIRGVPVKATLVDEYVYSIDTPLDGQLFIASLLATGDC